MIKFTVISAKAGIHLCQWVTDTSSPLRYSRNDEFPGHRVFFSNLLRHRQTKGAETDMPDLPPPRHFPTLPTAAIRPPESEALKISACAITLARNPLPR